MLQVLVCCFDLRDLEHVFEADCACRLVAWPAGALLYASSLLDKICRRWSLRGECERPVWLNSDQSWNRHADLDVRGPCIEILAEIH